MKNIHVLPTDKPSRLFELSSNLHLHTELCFYYKRSRNIYITSDEEIKDGDWFLTDDKRVEKCASDWRAREWHKKIILTTDQDLIKDGVQAIDDEFLEWFVKNPSCEYVNIEKYHGINTSIAEVNYISGDGSLNWQGKSDLRDFKIIIPQEEAKLDLEKEMFELEQELYIPSNLRWHNSKPKQETLEEVAERILNTNEVTDGDMILSDTFSKVVNSMVEIAKWQQEQDKNKYSEEEVLEQLNILMSLPSSTLDKFTDNNGNITLKWFEQFKNK
jgi:hypothetical protein